MSGSRIFEPQSPLLETDNEAVQVHVYYKRSPGGWRSASFMLAGGSLERFAYYGVESNLISCLTGPLGESVATAAANVNTWIGVVSLVPVLGAYLADSFLGRCRSIIIASILYILVSSQFYFYKLLLAFPCLLMIRTSNGEPNTNKGLKLSSHNQEIRLGYGKPSLFFVSLYATALAKGYKPCVQAFGADQFNGKHQEKSKAKSSFFNWWLCGLCIGSIAAHLILHYIQDNISWTIGFGIPCLVMILGLILFLLGHRTYFFDVKRGGEESPYRRIKWGIAKEGDALINRAQASSSQEECQEYLLSKTQQRSQDYR
ncbi:unnamed protein product [Coffea canephora]|uniref:Major facilitator superfamily (MFS) profile domain-containing protein n=1 Tax=Coffea canephora TaxID=49390 RepID=A0A068UXQ2_COFCA|nr:unnamed protein product [Coffea canephora]